MRSPLVISLVTLARAAAADCPINPPHVRASTVGDRGYTSVALAWLEVAIAGDRARLASDRGALGRELAHAPAGDGFASADAAALVTRLAQLDCAVLRAGLPEAEAARRFRELAADARRLAEAAGPPPPTLHLERSDAFGLTTGARRELRAGVAMLTLAAATLIGGAVSTRYAVDFARGWSLFYDARDRLIAGAVLCFGATAALAVGGATTLARGASRARVASFALAPTADGVRGAVTLAF